MLMREEENGRTYIHGCSGVCSREVMFTIDDNGELHNVKFTGGCNGNLKGIASLVEGMPATWAAERCAGITCGFKPTSCPDQLACGIKTALEKQQA